jgi:hypothetical protein
MLLIIILTELWERTIIYSAVRDQQRANSDHKQLLCIYQLHFVGIHPCGCLYVCAIVLDWNRYLEKLGRLLDPMNEATASKR